MDRPGWVALASFPVLAVPTVDVFPLGHHRAVDLPTLLSLTSPRLDPSDARLSFNPTG